MSTSISPIRNIDPGPQTIPATGASSMCRIVRCAESTNVARGSIVRQSRAADARKLTPQPSDATSGKRVSRREAPMPDRRALLATRDQTRPQLPRRPRPP